MAKVWKNHQLHICFIVLGIILVPGTVGDLLSECNSMCSSSGAVTSSSSDQCDLSCRISSCQAGCSSWDNSTLSVCQSACNETYSAEPYRVQYCQTGCLLAEDEYATRILDQIGDPTAPTPSEIASTTLTLMWTKANHSDVGYLIEWRYAEGGGTAWNYYGSGQPISDTSLSLTGLIPYAVYRFRVVWVVTPRHTRTSTETADIRTHASGVPSTAPTITSITSLSPTSISLAWDPPPFPNGPITGYTVAVRGFKINATAVVRFGDAATTEMTVIDSSFEASTLYAVQVSASNMEGIGPSDTVNVTTAAAPNVTGIIPYLVVGVTSFDFNVGQEASIISFVESDHLETGTDQNDIHTVDSENTTIVDVGVHYWQNMVFISDSQGRIHRRTVDPANLTVAASEVLYTGVDPSPSKLDVDWLNNRLFFVQGTEIQRCNLNVSDCEAVVTNVASVPFEMKVDPYLGYLFWSVHDSGIYIASLTTLPLDASSAALLVSIRGTSSFTVNTGSFQILYSNSSGNSMHSIQLDGSGQKELLTSRPSTGDMHQFENTTSIVFFNNSFTWTHVTEGTVESCEFAPYEYLEKDELYYETSPNVINNQNLFYCVSGFHGLDVFHPSYQPVPMPAYPPTNVQALFTNDTADISWTRPLSVPGKGAGAWEEWLYEITIMDMGTRETSIVDDIPEVSAVAENLTPSTEYSVQVRAYSRGGSGPQSQTFSGTTLQQVAVDPCLLLANNSNLWKAGLDGNSQANILIVPSPVRDIDWYQGYYIWSSTDNRLYRSTEGSVNAVELMVESPDLSSSVEAIAVDWLSGFIYWANEELNQIIQGRLSDASTITSPTVVNSLATDVQDMAIDSVQAYLYWTTRRSVEGSRLNGQSPLDFYETGDLSLDVVAGLTLDLGGGYLYWFVLSRQDSQGELKLFRARMAGYSSDPASTTEEIGIVQSATTTLDLHFYSSKFFWLNSDSAVVVSDDQGQRQALLPISDVQTLTVVQETLKPLPDGYTETPNVVPQDIPVSSIEVTGSWDDFNITWQASTEVTYGIVFYTIVVNAGQTYESTVEDAYFNIQDLSPFQSLSVTIQPYTYWASAQQAETQLSSPMSVPSVPRNPRAFALEDTDIMTGSSNYSAEFRWSEPEQINGILEGYNVSWGTDVEQLTVITVGASDLTYTIPGLESNTTYYFQVAGFTSVGSSPVTAPVNITTGVSSPPPMAVVSSGGVVKLTDLDTGKNTSLLGNTAVSVVAFVATEDIVFYVEMGEDEIYKSAVTESTPDKTSVVVVTGREPSSQGNFVVDWISQRLYWSDGASIYSFDTTLPSSLASTATLYTPPGAQDQIGGIAINPLGSSLVWTEKAQSNSVLMTSDLDGLNPTPLFGATTGRRRRQASGGNCTCSDTLSPGDVIYVDSTDVSAPSLYLIDGATSDIWVSDLEGCQCQRLFQASSQPNSGLPPDSMSVDSSLVYWSNSAQHIIASVDKETGGDFQSQTDQNDVGFVLTYGTSLQPFPAPECLAPPAYNQSTVLSSSGSDNLILTFDPVPQCPDVSAATVLYTVHYAEVNETTQESCTSGGLSCSQEMTTNTTATLNRLNPYTFQLTQVSAQNLYSSGTPQLGPVAIHRTSPGVPSAAIGVVAEVLTPFEARVVWSSPIEINGPVEELQFRVLYSTVSQDSRTLVSETVDEGGGQYSVVIDDVTAATEYTFTVESYQATVPGLRSSSIPDMKTTFQVPAQVQLVASTSTSLDVSWLAPDDNSATYHWIQYRPMSGDWEVALSGNTTSGTQYNVTIGEGSTDPLAPFTQYEVRTLVQYTSGRDYTYIGDEEILSATTVATAPASPDRPVVTETVTGTFQVIWSVPVANGPGDLLYSLDASGSSTGEWIEVYQGSATFWIVVDLATGDTYSFRVKASNDIGDGEYSPSTEPVLIPDPASSNTIFIIIGCVVIVLVIAAIVIIVLVCRHRRTDKWTEDGAFREDVELARLRNYPDMQIREENSNYAVTHEGKEVLLPIFARQNLSLKTFLGSGAFGEVFEGTALDIIGQGSGETRVAVKTLRKGATDQEKQEFLKEATVMGRFKHPNIVSLMGVCLDNDPQYIILELMEGGDLLSYVRAARTPPSTTSKISVMDQIEIILDVVKGCEYLEEIKFVHRDLAARNCLVSTKTYIAHERVVKIGDFGLARDIYKNDYYRKEGEGLLPVRWMSPEGLMDGFFSIQSDVWAFGVLVWEVVSGGQQPYPARSNVEVLRYVESGGRLKKPEKCPDDLYEVMLRCWEKLPDDRPSFKMLREMVQDFRRKSGGPRGADNFGFQNDGKVKYSNMKQDIPPEMMDYLMPDIDSKGDIIKKKPDFELPPDIDYDKADKDFEEDLKKKKTSRKGSKKGGRSPFNSLRGRLPGGESDGQPRLEAALHDIANKRREVDDDRYLRHPVGSMSKATGAELAEKSQPSNSDSLTVPGLSGAVGGASASTDGELEGAVGFSVSVTANGNAPNRTEPSYYMQPRKRAPNPFRANSMEELDGYDNLAFAKTGDVTDYGDV